MNWQEAVEQMRKGKHVVRASEVSRELTRYVDGVPVYECGSEAMRLANACTDSGQFVQVFQGAQSGVFFIPDADDMAATDWQEA